MALNLTTRRYGARPTYRRKYDVQHRLMRAHTPHGKGQNRIEAKLLNCRAASTNYRLPFIKWDCLVTPICFRTVPLCNDINPHTRNYAHRHEPACSKWQCIHVPSVHQIIQAPCTSTLYRHMHCVCFLSCSVNLEHPTVSTGASYSYYCRRLLPPLMSKIFLAFLFTFQNPALNNISFCFIFYLHLTFISVGGIPWTIFLIDFLLHTSKPQAYFRL